MTFENVKFNIGVAANKSELAESRHFYFLSFYFFKIYISIGGSSFVLMHLNIVAHHKYCRTELSC